MFQKGAPVSVRIFRALFFITILFIVVGCNGVPQAETVTRHGRVYKIGDRQPFTGAVTGHAREGYRKKRLKYEKHYKKGIRHGDTRFWYPNGKLESVEPYANGKINGIVTQYYESGQLKARIHMVDGHRGGAKGEQFWREDALVAKDFSKRVFK